MQSLELIVPPQGEGQRLDVYLAAASELTRARLAQLIEGGQVTIDGKAAAKPGQKLKNGMRISLEIPPAVPLELEPQELPLEILYQDADLAVIVKPCGMVVHPAAGNWDGTLVNALLYHMRDLSGVGGVLRPGIVHRLDKDTSGLMLIAKNDRAHLGLSAQLQEHTMRKTYIGLALGGFPRDEGSIEAPIARDPRDRKRMAVVPGGKQALTHYRVLERYGAATLLSVRIVTGRTHQIRVHLRSIGHPLVGDPVYGAKNPRVTASRLMLHAAKLVFVHPADGREMEFAAPPPAAFEAVLEKLRKQTI